MKKILFLIMLSISQLGFSQIKDTIDVKDSKSDSVQYYQYRLSFNGIKSTNFSEDAVTQLNDIFQTKPSFCEAIGQYLVISKKDVSLTDVSKPFENTDFKLVYFKKDLVNR